MIVHSLTLDARSSYMVGAGLAPALAYSPYPDQYITVPAETFRSSPVIEAALSLARKTAASATSLAGTRRPRGELLVKYRPASSMLMPFASACLRITHSMRSPSTPPGEMTLTRIPYDPASQASVLARPTRAILLAAYGVRPNSGRFPVIEPMMTIHPECCSIMAGRNARQHRYVPVTLTAKVSSQSAGAISHRGAVGPPMPLLFTSISTRPKWPSACVARLRTFSSWRMSIGTKSALRP